MGQNELTDVGTVFSACFFIPWGEDERREKKKHKANKGKASDVRGELHKAFSL